MSEKEERISIGVKRCLLLFKTGLELVGADATDGTGTRLSHQRDRFKVWTANIGGHQTGTSSLEYKLRDASNIRRNVLELLHDLAQLLEDFVAIAKGEMTPWDELPSEINEAIEEEGPKTEMQQIILHCKDIVDSLLGLSTTIRNPAPHDRFMAASMTEVSFYEKHDINHVRELYSDLLPWQVERLGATISRRRQYFRYRQTHHEKLAFGIDDEQDNKGEEKAPSTLASSIPDELRTKAFSALREEEQDEQEYMSQTSFATSTDQGDARRIPPLPEEAETGPFECPLCYCIILAQSRQKWKRHVFEDLRPTEKTHHRHVGRHMEQLSLFALPLIEGKDDSETGSDESRTSSSVHDTAQLSLSAPPIGGGQSDSDGYDGDARNASLEAYLNSPSQGRRISTYMQYFTEMKKHDGDDVFRTSAAILLRRYPTDDQRQFADDDGAKSSSLMPGTAKPPSPEASAAGRGKIDDIYKTIADDDVLLIRNCGVDYPTHFPRNTIGDGKLEVSDVTERAGSMMGLPPRDWRSLKLFYNGKQLKDQSEAISEHGIRNNSVITAVLPEGHAHVDALDEKMDIVGETTSLGDSISHGSANSASPISGAARPPSQEASAVRRRQLDKIANDFQTRWLPMCKEYIDEPPIDQRERADKHRRLSEVVLQEVVLKLDELETDGNPDVQQKRKDLVRKVQDVLKQVDVARGHVDN
ncbi:BAG domain protein [Akanthomyces lecanii RCEF 1005]|uniref:BAG domain protein n=1 Tax=Akanthomyces lecanii RCEF 1005 TaxID=1081108 RepID=A0A167ZMD4_CORDF|nr:BAG domain protein [Akanthomyces lecanii RCEF 1005]